MRSELRRTLVLAGLVLGCAQPQVSPAQATRADSAHTVARARSLLDNPTQYVVSSYVRKSHGVLVGFVIPVRQDSTGFQICADCDKDICVPDSGTPAMVRWGMMTVVPAPAACRDDPSQTGAL